MKKFLLILSFCFLVSCQKSETIETTTYSTTAVQTGITAEQQQALDDFLIDLEWTLKSEWIDQGTITQAIEEAREEELKKMK